MTQSSLPGYLELNQVLDKTDLKLQAAEAHGLMSGILCASHQELSWEKHIIGDNNAVQVSALLQTLYQDTAKRLEEFLFEFQLYLPEDSEALPVRAEALTLWCQSFLTGLKTAGVPITGRESSEVTEAINDIIEIAKMNYEEVVPSEEDETAYVELVEYVRVAVILIYQEFHVQDQQQSSEAKNHVH